MQFYGSENVRRRVGVIVLVFRFIRLRRGSFGVYLKFIEFLVFWLAGGVRGRFYVICRQLWVSFLGYLGLFLLQSSVYFFFLFRDTRGFVAGSVVLRLWGRFVYRLVVYLFELKVFVVVVVVFGVVEVVVGGRTVALFGGFFGRWFIASGSWYKLVEVLVFYVEFFVAVGQDVFVGGAGVFRFGRVLGGSGYVFALVRFLVERVEGIVNMSFGYDMILYNGRDFIESSDNQGIQSFWCGL